MIKHNSGSKGGVFFTCLHLPGVHSLTTRDYRHGAYQDGEYLGKQGRPDEVKMIKRG
jgi:hypothetical protein